MTTKRATMLEAKARGAMCSTGQRRMVVFLAEDANTLVTHKLFSVSERLIQRLYSPCRLVKNPEYIFAG
jgi:hypothetical protein